VSPVVLPEVQQAARFLSGEKQTEAESSTNSVEVQACPFDSFQSEVFCMINLLFFREVLYWWLLGFRLDYRNVTFLVLYVFVHTLLQLNIIHLSVY